MAGYMINAERVKNIFAYSMEESMSVALRRCFLSSFNSTKWKKLPFLRKIPSHPPLQKSTEFKPPQ